MDFIDLLCIFHGLKGRMEAWRKVCSRPIEARWPDGGRLENPIGPPDGTPIGQARLKNGHRAFFCRHRAIGPIWARWARGTQRFPYKIDWWLLLSIEIGHLTNSVTMLPGAIQLVN